MNERTLVEIIRKIVAKELTWLRHYYARVVNTNDPIKKGRVKVVCFDLGFDSEGNGIWVAPRDKNALTTLKQGDWTEIYFIGGDREHGVHLGKAVEFDNMLPKNYKGAPSSHVVFEDPDNKIHIGYDSGSNEMEIGNTDMQAVARKTDEVTSDTTSDSQYWAFITAFFGVITGAPIPEPGNGSPSALQFALNSAIISAGGTPSSQKSTITTGSDQVKVGKK